VTSTGRRLDVGAITDGQVLQRSGDQIISSPTAAPSAHHLTHENGGSDEINVGGLDGVLAQPQPPIIGATATTAVAGNDSRLTNARTPTAHATTHQPGGSDAMAVDAIAGTGSLRTLGSGAQQAAAGNHIHAEADVTNLVTDLAAKVPTTRTISTTAPLTGGGDLSANRTLAISDFVASGASHARGAVPDPGAVAGSSKFLREDATWASPGASSFVMSTVECNLATIPATRRSGHIQITGLSGLTAGKPVLVQQAQGPYTGKGTRADEADMDAILVNGQVLNATTIDLFWSSRTQVHGKFKFNYVISG
jgi:hypothetical protein